MSDFSGEDGGLFPVLSCMMVKALPVQRRGLEVLSR